MQSEAPVKPNWRSSYHESREASAGQLRKERSVGSQRLIDVPGKRHMVSAYNLTEDDIAKAADEEARRDLNRAIIEWNEAEARRKSRSGEAY